MKLKPVFFAMVSFTACSLLMGCHDTWVRSIKFNKAKWDSVGDLHSYPLRESMINDLLTNHRIKGLTYKQLIDSLGEPMTNGEAPGDNMLHDSIYYDIAIDYGHHDPRSPSYQPLSGSYLVISFNKDSVATGFDVVHWKNSLPNK